LPHCGNDRGGFRVRRTTRLTVALSREWLAKAASPPHDRGMSKKEKAAAAIAGAVGSAAVAAALLYVNRRKDRKKGPEQPGPIPSGEPPQSD
jgi:hypothetical protein